MHDYSDHSHVLKLLGEAQDVETDNRENVRESALFVTKKDGQWEPKWYNQVGSDSPRYTFDMTKPIVRQISSKLKQADFDIKIRPAGGESTKDTAKILDGMVRNIESQSNAIKIFNAAAKKMSWTGLAGWEVVTDYVDSDSFDQDILIKPILNFEDRVWYDPEAQEQDKSDAEHGFKLSAIGPAVYDERWPKGGRQGLGENYQSNAYYYKKEYITVGQIFYAKYKSRELVQFSNGAVYENNADLKKVTDELAAQGITETGRRKRDKRMIYSRLFDGGGWLNEEQLTPWEWVPLVPDYANYDIVENKTVYCGAIQDLMDPQRVLNYAKSREIGEGALAPRAKYWMTPKQAAGYTDELSTLNTNTDPVQFYNPDMEAPGSPQQNGGAQINPGLQTISTEMVGMMSQVSGMHAVNMGENPGLQSGVAIEKLQEKGDASTVDYFESHEIAIGHTGKIIVKAIPKVYDTERQERLLAEDGTEKLEMINQSTVDEETGEDVVLNDLTKGSYDVVCSSGPSFQNRQQETASSMIEVATVLPGVMDLGADIFLSNINSPGMEELKDRARVQLFKSGTIPIEQWTEEELQKAQFEAQQAQQQPPQPDPNMMIAQGAMMEGQAKAMDAQTKQIALQAQVKKDQTQAQLNVGKLQIEQGKVVSDARNDQITAHQNGIKLMQDQQQTQFENIMAMQNLKIDEQASAINNLVSVMDTFIKAQQVDNAQENTIRKEAVDFVNGQGGEMGES